MADSPNEKNLIHFRCSQCTRPLKVDASLIGQKVLCPVCYHELIVPDQSQPDRRQVNPNDLYGVDTVPRDTRQLRGRFNYTEVRCPVCLTGVSVTEAQINSSVECPDCGTRIPVTRQAFLQGQARQEQLRRHQSPIDPRGGRNSDQGGSANQIYGVRSGGAPSSSSSPGVGNGSGNVKLIPVYCTLCGTLMYARTDQIGTQLTCPDCDTKVTVKPPVELPPDTKLPRSTGGEVYGLSANPQGYGRQGPGSDSPRADSDLLPVRCPVCETLLYAKKSDIGKKTRCPDCGTDVPICDLTAEQKIAAQKIEPVMTGGYDIGLAPPGPPPSEVSSGGAGRVTASSVPPPIPQIVPIHQTAPPQAVPSQVPPVSQAPPVPQTPPRGPSDDYVPRYARRTQGVERPQSAEFVEDARFRQWVREQSGNAAPKKKKRKLSKKEIDEEYNGWIPKIDDRGNVVLTFPPPPRYPMAPSLFTPALNGMFWAQWLAPIMLTIIAWLAFQYVHFSVLKNGWASLRSINPFQFAPYTFAIVICVVSMVFSLRGAAINLMSEFNTLASGHTRIEEWEDMPMVDGFVTLIRMAVIEFFVICPVAVCCRLGIPPIILGTAAYAAQILFFPVAFLSTLDSEHFAVPFNGAVVGTIFRRFGSWFAFYFWSVLITAPFCVLAVLLADKPYGTWIIAALLPLPLPLYTLPLCRLGWVVSACVRRGK